MRLLGIDWGKAKVGLALSSGSLASPLRVIQYKQENILIKKILNILNSENVEKIIVGLSEKESAKNAKAFAESLSKKTDLEIVFEDETLSTKMAQALALEAGIGREKRKKMEDAYAATLILQEYLDNLQI